jgi:hypothetical protein
MRVIFLMVSFMVWVYIAQAQDDVSRYFEDGGIAKASRLIKVGFDPVNGEIPFIFEHQIAKHISVEWGASSVFLKRQAKLYEDIQNSSAMGFNLWVNLRIYLNGYYERFYVGFQPRVNFLDQKTYTDIVFFNCGYQRPLSGRWVFDINAGMGVRSYKEDPLIIGKVKHDRGRNSAFVIPVQFKLGYAF